MYVEGDHAWVTLRGTGELASIALDTMTLEWKTRVCLEPRGVTRALGAIVVACAGGELVEVEDDGEISRLVVIDPDLRDIVVDDDDLLVSRFATAEVLRIDPARLEVLDRISLGSNTGVAWRMRMHDREALVLHQVAIGERIQLGGDGSLGFDDEHPPPAYSGAATCTGAIVSTMLTEVSGSTFDAILVAAPVGTDFVVTEDQKVAVVSAGAADDAADVFVFAPFEGVSGMCLEAVETRVLERDGRASAVAIDVDGSLVFQSASPVSLVRAEEDGVLVPEASDPTTEAAKLFHTDAGVGISCASCHPEGLDDGQVWVFLDETTTTLLRRTLPLAGRILSRQPYHWDAELVDPHALMTDTFVSRMGGPPVDETTTTALFEWIEGLRHVRAHPAAPESAIEIGREAFAVAGCDGCHTGAAFTNGAREHIGRPWEVVKTPSLLGVGARNHLLHDGCYLDLHDRFIPGHCDVGPHTHGDLSRLTGDEIEALEAYLRTL